MKAAHSTVLILLTLISLSCTSKGKESYWRIKTIYREDKKPIYGLSGASMEEINDYNFHFIKKGDILHFELPEKLTLDTRNFKTLKQLGIQGKDYYEMYAFEFSGSNFRIKFKDNATASGSKNTIIEFEEISEEDFKKDIADEIAHQKDIAEKINTLKIELEKHPLINLNPVKKLPTKVDSLMANTGEEILLETPTDIRLKESGDLKNEVFGSIKIGTLKDKSAIYDVQHKGEDYGLKQLTIWISTDSSKFTIAEFLAKKINTVVYKRDKDSIVGYDISFDGETNQAVVNSFFCLKYFKAGDSHVFIYGDATRSQIKNFPNDAEMNKILNFNYSLSENISLKIQ